MAKNRTKDPNFKQNYEIKEMPADYHVGNPPGLRNTKAMHETLEAKTPGSPESGQVPPGQPTLRGSDKSWGTGGLV